MSIATFLSNQAIERQALLTKIHELIIEEDKTVSAGIGLMMGKEMIAYNAPETFKYGLASMKNYMSLHVMPIYCSPDLYNKYKALLSKASFQKGCINFKHEDQMPLAVVRQLIRDSAKVDLQAIKESYQKSKSK